MTSPEATAKDSVVGSPPCSLSRDPVPPLIPWKEEKSRITFLVHSGYRPRNHNLEEEDLRINTTLGTLGRNGLWGWE